MLKIRERGFIIDENRPTASCHASTVAKTSKGLIAAWFGGSKEGAPDVDIYLSRYRDGQWSDPEKVSAEPGIAHWNPVLFAAGDHVTLFYKVGVHIYDWKTMRRDSFDGGETFSPPSELVPGDASGGRGPVKNKPILLSDGAILAPASHESADGRWRAFADRSDDGGRTFTVSAYFATADASVKLIQPSFWEDKNGVHAFIRSDQGVIYRADSADLGRTWGMAYPTALPNNNAGLDLARLPDGRLLLASNPVGENWGKRTPLTLSVSEDGGSTFRRLLDLETEDDPASPRSARYEFSYPAVLADGQSVYITYTHRRERIAYAILGE